MLYVICYMLYDIHMHIYIYTYIHKYTHIGVFCFNRCSLFVPRALLEGAAGALRSLHAIRNIIL